MSISNTPSHNKSNERLVPLDALRGLIIIVMALDHANWFIAQKHPQGEMWGGSFPAYQDSLTFLTRFITHIAAPGFFFLMGAGMLLFAQSRSKKGWSRWEIIRYFLIRGVFLIALQLLVINRAWELSPGGWIVQTYIGVLFALGGCMIISSFLLWLKPEYLLILTIGLFVGSELLAPDPSLWGQYLYVNFIDKFTLLLIRPGGTQEIWSNYPILPWLELVTFGMVFGYWLGVSPKKAYNKGLILGLLFLIGFILIRYLDGFGNIRPRFGDTWIDFLNVVKYPPSMAFTMLTMGLNLIILWSFYRIAQKWDKIFYPLVVFGQAPLFFYMLHLFLYAGIGLWLTPEGTSIIAMYPYWILGLLLLLPLCLWFGRFKRGQPKTSIIRFL
jgi:uncharacterized membrane protein